VFQADFAALLLAFQGAHGSAPLAIASGPLAQAVVGVVLVGVFVALVLEKTHRLLVVGAGACLLWLITYLTPLHVVPFEITGRLLDLNVLFLLAGMMVLVGVLRSTSVFEWAVAALIHRTRGQSVLVLTVLVWFTGIFSAFADNVTTVLFVTPMAIGMSRELKLPPLALLLPVVMASNIGGTATLIGDPPNIMIGSGAGIPFMDFILNLALPVAVMMFLLEWFSRWYYRRELGATTVATVHLPEVPAISDPQLLRWTTAVIVLVFVGFFTQRLTGMPPAIPATVGAAAALVAQDWLYVRRERPRPSDRLHGISDILVKDVEWATLLFFGFLFVVVGAAVEVGLIGAIANQLTAFIHSTAATLSLSDIGKLVLAAILICWVSGLLSSVIDNIPFVAVSIPIVAQLVRDMPGESAVLWWALSLGACLGGNGTAVGASANVTVIGLAERAGTPIAFRTFTRFGLPVMLGTLVASSVYLAVYVFLGHGVATIGCAALVAAFLIARRFGTQR
jgi:Na+/H+ antiporter NhaD/arsenite permease-like protein